MSDFMLIRRMSEASNELQFQKYTDGLGSCGCVSK